MGERAIIRSFPQVGPFRDAVIAGAAAEAAQIEVVWGGDYLTQYEIRRVRKHDVQWAAVSFGLVGGAAQTMGVERPEGGGAGQQSRLAPARESKGKAGPSARGQGDQAPRPRTKWVMAGRSGHGHSSENTKNGSVEHPRQKSGGGCGAGAWCLVLHAAARARLLAGRVTHKTGRSTGDIYVRRPL